MAVQHRRSKADAEPLLMELSRAVLGGRPTGFSIVNHSGNGPDRSRADFTRRMTSIDRGWNIKETAAKLPEVGEKARELV